MHGASVRNYCKERMVMEKNEKEEREEEKNNKKK